jgi:hypothetical protein
MANAGPAHVAGPVRSSQQHSNPRRSRHVPLAQPVQDSIRRRDRRSRLGRVGERAEVFRDEPRDYHFTVFALDTDKLDIPASATAAYVGFNLHAHTLAKAEIVALYGR